MNRVYVLYCEHWTWTKASYDIEFITAFKDEELAYRTALSMQQSHSGDSRYIVNEVEFDGFEP